MNIRIERLKELIRVEAAELITSHLNDPRIGFCTVVGVELTADLSYAKIHVSVLGDEAQKRTTMRGLQDARGLIQRRIAGRMRTRTTPHVEIVLDESVERSFHILEKIREARASDPDHGATTAPPASDDATGAGGGGGGGGGKEEAEEDAEQDSPADGEPKP
jgi:ribosome-binding factor A